MSSGRWLSPAARRIQSGLAVPRQAPATTASRAFATSAPVSSDSLNTTNTPPPSSSTTTNPSSSANTTTPQPQPQRSPSQSRLPFTGPTRKPQRSLRSGSLGSMANQDLREMVSAGFQRAGGSGSGLDSGSRQDLRFRALEQYTNLGRQEVEAQQRAATSEAYLRYMNRRFEPGDVYTPRDLEPQHMSKWRQYGKAQGDVVDLLGFNPIDNYKNFSLISEFITPMGRIKHSAETGLRPVNQRKMAKAIRRAIGLGIYPSVHKHPEILKMQANQANIPAAMLPTTGRT